jgi:hypothetical protein
MGRLGAVMRPKGSALPTQTEFNAALAVTLAEDLEEELGAGLGKRHIAEFVDDEQFDGGGLGF